MKLALVTCDAYVLSAAAVDDWYVGNILREDALLAAALATKACQCERVSWSDATVDWASYDAAVIRSTWDYFHRFAEFQLWLDNVTRLTRLCNPLSILRWNIDKHYLLDLQGRGLPIVPSAFIEAGSTFTLQEVLDANLWSKAVVKPCISGAARHTYRFDHQTAHQVEAQLADLREREAFIVQPFMPAIIDHGEDTLVMAGQQFTHAIRKRAKAGDFRVQDDHGGTVAACQALPEQIELAVAAMEACQPSPAYGRVDMVRDERGRWLIMELELIEPELWMRLHPPSAQEMACAIVDSLHSN